MSSLIVLYLRGDHAINNLLLNLLLLTIHCTTVQYKFDGWMFDLNTEHTSTEVFMKSNYLLHKFIKYMNVFKLIQMYNFNKDKNNQVSFFSTKSPWF